MRAELDHQHYDMATAVTFFLAGLGVGSLLALIFAPRGDFLFGVPASLLMQSKGHFPTL